MSEIVGAYRYVTIQKLLSESWKSEPKKKVRLLLRLNSFQLEDDQLLGKFQVFNYILVVNLSHLKTHTKLELNRWYLVLTTIHSKDGLELVSLEHETRIENCELMASLLIGMEGSNFNLHQQAVNFLNTL